MAECVSNGPDIDGLTVRKEVTPPGEVAEIDYGRVGLWFDRLAQRQRIVNGFIMTLPSSRHVFVDPVLSCDQRSWVASHVAAFEFFGGVPAVLRLDNLKTGVLRPDIYDPQLNRAHGEMAEHFGVLLDPCRAGKPKDKPRDERTSPTCATASGVDATSLDSWRCVTVRVAGASTSPVRDRTARSPAPCSRSSG